MTSMSLTKYILKYQYANIVAFLLIFTLVDRCREDDASGGAAASGEREPRWGYAAAVSTFQPERPVGGQMSNQQTNGKYPLVMSK